MVNKILLVLLIISMLLAGCSSEKAPLDERKASELFKFVAIDDPVKISYKTFSMIKPRDWKEVVRENNVIIYLPPKSDEKDPFSEKFGIIVSFLPENNTASLREITENDVEESIKASPGVEFSGKYYDARLGQLDGLKIEFVNRVEDRELESTQIRALHGNVFYAFTQQCLKGKCKYTDVFEEMIASFEWKNP